MKRLKLIGAMAAIASFAFLFSCGGSDDGTPACQLDVLFSAPTSAVTGQLITPSNQTLNAVSYSWDFGDGSAPVSSSTLTAPSHAYTTPGSYTITLTAYCEAGQAGSSSDFTSNITVTQANPTAIFDSFFFSKEDGSAVYPVGINFALINRSTESSSYTVDWGDGVVENYSAAELEVGGAATHVYTAGDFTITATAYEQANQGGLSDETTLSFTVQNYNRFRADRFTLHPALTDSLSGLDDGTNGANDDTDNSGPDILMLFHEYGSDPDAGFGLFLLTAIEDVLRDVETITTDIDINVGVEFNDGSVQEYWDFYAPKEAWDQALNPIFQSNNLGANIWSPQASFAGIWDLDETNGNFVQDIYFLRESALVGLSTTATSYTWNDASGRPLITMHFTVEEQTGQ